MKTGKVLRYKKTGRVFNIGELTLIAVVSGCVISYAYIGSHTGSIQLSVAILELSGRRGEFPLAFSFVELLEFYMRYIPYIFAFLSLGTEIYQNYCTASVYVFTRIHPRTGWFLKEAVFLFLKSMYFQFVLQLSELGVTFIRYDVIFDAFSSRIFLLHYSLHVLWFYLLCLLINLLAVYFGSEGAFAAVIGTHSLFLALLSHGEKFESLIRFNPVANLVLDWHVSASEMLMYVFCDGRFQMSFIYSFLLFSGMILLVLFAGCFIVTKHDFIAGSVE